ncbi:MAG TPA: hypothetical protein VFU47_02390 [Armatimonadota bacterium]|nr:hypothetical protein [Armatimonadota bacterium]
MAADKLPLRDFVGQVADQWAAAAEAIERQHPDWEIGAVTITARVAFVLEKGQVLVDLDEPDRLLTELPIPLRRKASA